ncbi:MAG: pentapeptide repeat-containing protein [Ktedonobacterales bacterium]|nr:pentapeptide repeat-containing protein [Ktedonobacterales bacterium]
MDRRKSRTSIKPPGIPKALPLAELPHDLPADGETYERLEYQHLDFGGQVLVRPHFAEVIFTHLIAPTSQVHEVRMEDVRFVGCNLANATWVTLSCVRAEFSGSRLTGWIAQHATFRDTVFHDCQLDLAQFFGAQMHQVRFDDCPLAGVDFREADVSGVVFARCDLTNADFRGAKLAGADLRGCTIDGMRVGPDELRGARVDEVQALALVRAMGIIVE